jgi:hypothetical protein
MPSSIYIKFYDFVSSATIGATFLLSATCIGNDGKSCPLFHSSLAPRFFSVIDTEFINVMNLITPFDELLLNSNTICWAPRVCLSSTVWCDAEGESKEHHQVRKVCDTLASTRYSSRSIKTLTTDSNAIVVCQDFVKNHCEVLETVVFYGTHENSFDGNLSFLSQSKSAKSIRTLHFYGVMEITDDDIKLLVNLSSLRTLKIMRCENVSAEGLVALAPLANSLREFSFAGIGYYDEDVQGIDIAVEKFNCLEKLYLSLCRIADLQNMLTNLPLLKILDLNACDGITDDDHIQGLEHLRVLESFSMSCIPSVTGKHFHLLPPTLREIHLNSMVITNEGFESIAQLTSVEVLDLTNSTAQLTDELFVKFASLKNLRELIVAFSSKNITDSSFLELAKTLTTLEVLDVASCVGISDVAFVALLPPQKNLRRLHAAYVNRLTDETLKIVGNYNREMEVLRLSNCTITDVGLDALITEDAKSCKLPFLKEIDVTNCREVTSLAVDRIEQVSNGAIVFSSVKYQRGTTVKTQ